MLNKVTKACIRFKNPIILRSKWTASGSSPFVSSQIQLTEKRLYKIGKLAESNFQRPIEYLKTFIKKKNKDYLLVFQGTYKGRVNLKINTFFERESVDDSGSLGNFFLFSKLENNKLIITYFFYLGDS